MGVTNLRYGLENKIAQYRGELEAVREEVQLIETGVTRLSSLHQRTTDLEALVKAAEAILKHDHPDFQPAKIKPLRPRVWKSPFKAGEIGRTALTILRECGAWMRPSELAKVMLERIGFEGDDRSEREKLANSVGNYFRKHEGDLVESRGSYAKEWRVIRQTA